MIKVILKILLVLFVIIFQISFISNFDLLRTKINFILILLTFFTLLFNFQQTLFWGVFSGYFLDYYSSLPFGLISLSLLVSIVIIYFLFENYFTNRSLVTLVLLIASATLAFHLSLTFFSYIFSVFGWLDFHFTVEQTITILIQIFLNALIAVFIYIIYTILNDRFKQNFLVKGNL